jgi:hypothetical protein
MLGRMGTEDEMFARLNAGLTSGRAKKWGKGSVESWAEQIHELAQKKTYGQLPKAPAGGQIHIDTKYEKMAAPVIMTEIEKAGARLAFVLNRSLK